MRKKNNFARVSDASVSFHACGMTCDYSDSRMTLILRKPTKEKVKRYVKVSRRVFI